jgi:hypothetical protein
MMHIHTYVHMHIYTYTYALIRVSGFYAQVNKWHAPRTACRVWCNVSSLLSLSLIMAGLCSCRAAFLSQGFAFHNQHRTDLHCNTRNYFTLTWELPPHDALSPSTMGCMWAKALPVLTGLILQMGLQSCVLGTFDAFDKRPSPIMWPRLVQ